MPPNENDRRPTPQEQAALDEAVRQAELSASQGGVPIGSSLMAPDGSIVAAGHNERVQSGDPTAHAETVCIRRAGRRRDWQTLTLVTTLSPCAMCSGTAVLFRIPRVVIGERDTFLGREDWLAAEGVGTIYADDDRCRELMRAFIRDFRDVWDEDIGEPD